MKLTVKKILLQICGYALSIAPLAVYVGLNWQKYTATTASRVSLGVGGAMVLVLVLLKALDRMPKNVKPIIRYSVAFVIVLALEPLILDLKYLLAMALAGEVLDLACVRWAVTRTQKQIDAQITVDAQKQQQQELLDAIKNINSGDEAEEGRT